MMEYCSTDKAYIKKGNLSQCQKAYMQIYYPQFSCQNPRMLHVPLDVQLLVLIVWGRFISMKNKTHHHRLLCKSRL